MHAGASVFANCHTAVIRLGVNTPEPYIMHCIVRVSGRLGEGGGHRRRSHRFLFFLFLVFLMHQQHRLPALPRLVSITLAIHRDH